MMRLLLSVALFALIAFAPGAGVAQTPTPAPVPATAASAPALTAAQAQQALEVLQDPHKREQLISVLQAIAKAAPAAAPAEPANAPANSAAPAAPAPAAAPAEKPNAVTLSPNSLGAQLLVALSEWSARVAGEGAAAIRAMANLPALWNWLTWLAANPASGAQIATAAGWLAFVFAIALLFEFLAGWALRRPREALLRHAPRANGANTRLLRALPFALMQLVFDLVPVALFAATGNLLSGAIGAIDQQTRLVIVAVVYAYAGCRAVMCFGRLLLSPADRRLRLLRVSDDDARFFIVWLRRLTVVAIFGEAIVEVALLLGVDPGAHDGFERLIALILAVMLVVLAIRSRLRVAAYVRGRGGSRWRSWLAEAWPYLAVITIVSFWIGSANGTHGGLAGLYFPGVTLGAIIAARLLTIIVVGSLERLMRLDPEAEDRLPGLSDRMALYRRPLEFASSAVIAALSIVVVLQLWGAPAFAWFVAGGIGTHLVSALLTIAVAVVAAIAIWEVSHAVLERHLAADGQNRSVRLLTLLPILRTALLATILTVVGLTALSEIGVNIAPLLAGAGIAGIAIGFGAQHLVQDVITGVFVLFENAIQIGDGVTVAGLSGAVEQLSVRTLRLRAGDGAVHIIPFSSVTTITNSNRGIGNAPVSVTVAYDEDTDRVAEILSEIAAEMRADDEYKRRMLGDLQVFGVDQVKPWGVTVTGQIACTDTGRWPVQREFNRRLKLRFQELKIVLSAPPGG